MNVLRCLKSDAAEIAALEKKYLSAPWSLENIEAALERADYALYKICESGKIIAYGGVQVIFDEADITNIVVEEEHRRKGCAGAIVEKIKEHCKLCDAKKIWLEVYEENRAAVALYEKHGFVKAYARKNYYREGDALVMSCGVPCSESVKV